MLMKNFKDEYLEISQKAKVERDIWKKQKEELRKEYLIKEFGINSDEQKKQKLQYENIYTLEKSAATVLYVIVMFIGAIFIDRLIIWVVATIIWWKHIHKHNKKK